MQNNIVTTQANTLVQMQKKEQEIVAKQSEAKKEKTKQSEPVAELSTNDKILLMKEEGKSVIEISKALRMGQGEVQLILGLFGK